MQQAQWRHADKEKLPRYHVLPSGSLGFWARSCFYFVLPRAESRPRRVWSAEGKNNFFLARTHGVTLRDLFSKQSFILPAFEFLLVALGYCDKTDLLICQQIGRIFWLYGAILALKFLKESARLLFVFKSSGRQFSKAASISCRKIKITINFHYLLIKKITRTMTRNRNVFPLIDFPFTDFVSKSLWLSILFLYFSLHFLH